MPSQCAFLKKDGRCVTRGCRWSSWYREHSKRWLNLCRRPDTDSLPDALPDMCTHPEGTDGKA